MRKFDLKNILGKKIGAYVAPLHFDIGSGSTALLTERGQSSAAMTHAMSFLAALLFVSALFAGCDGLASGSAGFWDGGSSSSQGGTAYISLGKVKVDEGGISHSVLPEAAAPEEFSDFELEILDKGGETESYKKIAAAPTLAKLSEQLIEVQSGSQRFRLKAVRGSANFSGQTDVNLQSGKTTALTFTMRAESGSKGSIFVTVNFEGAATKAVYELKQGEAAGPVKQGDALLEPAEGGGTATVSIADLDAGAYELVIKFSGGENGDIQLNTYGELVRVGAGLASRAERDIDLNQLYKIIYHDLPDGVVIEGGGTLPQNYSRKSGTIALPNLSLAGKYFAGYFASESFSDDSIVTEINASETRDIDIYPCLTDTIYAKHENLLVQPSGWSESQAVGSVEDAIRKISSIGIWQDPNTGDTPYASMDWKIVICDEYQADGATTIDDGLDGRAASVTLVGSKPNSAIYIDSGFNGAALAVDCATPINISNLTLQGGMDGMTISNAGAKVTLQDGARVSGNHAHGADGGGVVISEGELVMESGSIIEGNEYYAIYADPASEKSAKITMKGSARLGGGAEDTIYLGRRAVISVAGALNGDAPVATITPASYLRTTPALVDDVAGALVAQYHNKIYVAPDGAINYVVDESGYIVNSDAASLPPNVLPANLIFVANAASGGASGNEGTEANPLDSIAGALGKIKEIVEDANSGHTTTEEWGIVLLSDLEGAQTVTTEADGKVFKLYIASKSAADIKTINGGFTSAPVNPSDNQTALTVESQIRYIVIQCVKITGGYAGEGGGLVHRGWNLDLMPGVEIYGNKAVAKGAGVYVQASSNYAAYLNIKGAVIRDNVCASANGSGGGVYILGSQEGVSKRSLFTLESGSITGNKADYGAGICAEGDCYVTIEDGSITSNSNYTTGTGAGGGIYLSKPTGSFIPKFEIKKGSITSNTSQEVGGIYARDAQLTFSGGTISGNTASSGTGQGLYAYNSDASSISLMSWRGNVSFGANDVVYLSNTAINVGAALTCAFVATIEPASYAIDTLILVDGVKEPGFDLTSLYDRFAIKPESDGTEWHLESKPYTLSNGNSTTSGVLKQGAASGSGGGGTSGNVVNLYVNSLSGYGSDSNDGLSEDSALMTLGAAFDKMTDSTKDYVVNVMSKIWQDGLTSDYSQLEISSGVMANSIKITGTNTDSDKRVITGQYDSAGPGTVMKVTSSVPVTIESITITGGCSDSDHKGGCIEIGSGATVILGNDTYIQGGMVNGGFGGGVYVSADSTFIMKGNSVVQADQYSAVYLEEGAKIMIGSNLTGRTSDSIPYVAQITPASYSSTTAKIGIVSGSGTSLAAEHSKFAVTPSTQFIQTGQGYQMVDVNYIINESGMLEEVAGGSGGGGTSGNVTLYVKDGGSGDGSSEDSAFGTLAEAASYIESNGNSSTDYDIKIVEDLEEPQAFIINNASKAKSITIEGATGLDANGAPQCAIDGDVERDIDGVLLISVNNDELMGSPLTVTVKNLKIYNGTAPKPGLVAGHNNGLGYTSTNVILEGVHITENSDGGIQILNKSSVTLSNNCKVYSNTAAGNGSGVHVYTGAKFTMSGSAVVASDNDVYLESGAKITIGNALTPELSPVALIRVPDSEYQEDTNLQILDESTSGLINSYYQYFGVICPEGPGYSGSGYGYTINSSGELNYYNYN